VDWGPYLQENWYIFNDFHAYLAYCQAGEYEFADSLLEAMRVRERKPSPEVFDIFTGFGLFSTGEYAEAANRLTRSYSHSHEIGGSNAQRDVIEITAIEAALRSGNYEFAKQIRDAGRLFRHPSPMLSFYSERLKAL
jgi:pentatricopeptide repeat protein